VQVRDFSVVDWKGFYLANSRRIDVLVEAHSKRTLPANDDSNDDDNEVDDEVEKEEEEDEPRTRSGGGPSDLTTKVKKRARARLEERDSSPY
jgi:hypothetical protein